MLQTGLLHGFFASRESERVHLNIHKISNYSLFFSELFPFDIEIVGYMVIDYCLQFS